ncbi:MAG TPA: glucokinase [Pyrinomonadaceae bacterium]|nr:glucokinase [Pyrinomonadaceae bacterium]
MILAGDIGGTKTNVALFEHDALEKPLAQRSFPSGKYDSLESIISEFIAEHQPQVKHACFGIAGPVKDGQVRTPNLKWVVDGQTLARALGIARVGLINDLEATAYGIEGLGAAQLHALNEGMAEQGAHRALIAAGTGLGMAGLFYDGHHYRPIASEGGHIDYAPRTGIEHELLNYMRGKIGGRVSYERVLSGPGLFNIYSFLRDHKYGEEPDWLAAEIKAGDGSAAVSQAGLAGTSELAVKALDLFADIYGAMAGNLALLLKATGGLYVGGGIAPKLIEKLKDGTFMRAFKDKGRMSALVSNIPVRVILDDKTALYGAARCAVEQV